MHILGNISAQGPVPSSRTSTSSSETKLLADVVIAIAVHGEGVITGDGKSTRWKIGGFDHRFHVSKVDFPRSLWNDALKCAICGWFPRLSPDYRFRQVNLREGVQIRCIIENVRFRQTQHIHDLFSRTLCAFVSRCKCVLIYIYIHAQMHLERHTVKDILYIHNKVNIYRYT